MCATIFSQRVVGLQSSPIREILAAIDRPGMVSFAGGLPAPETFPEIDLGEVPKDYLQYGPSEGEMPLREQIAADLCANGLKCYAEQVLILSGSQQGIDLVAKLFIDPGASVIVESPTYLAALQVFRFFGASLVEAGPEIQDTGMHGTARLAYLIPTFQNPTGRCYSLAERTTYAHWCDEAGITVFEDDPYRDLKYDPCDRTPVSSLLRRSSWVYQGSFSKTLAPGLRLGFLAASRDLLEPLRQLKQATDLHSSRISQWLVLQHLRDPNRSERLATLQHTYREKRDAFSALLEEHWSDIAEWRIPAGGLFFWLQLKFPTDTRLLLSPALERSLAFMPGEPFFADSRGPRGYLRLNFSHASKDIARRGLRDLADLIRSSRKDTVAKCEVRNGRQDS